LIFLSKGEAMRWSGWMRTGLLILLIGLLVSGGMLRAQEEGAPPDDRKSAKADARIEAAARKRGLNTRLENVNLVAADLPETVRLLSEKAGVNVAIGDDVKGTVTCSLSNVTARDALSAFLQANGYDFVERNNVLVVVKAVKMPEPEKVVTARKLVRRTFRLPFSGKEIPFAPTTGGGAAGLGAGEKLKGLDQTISGMLTKRGKMVYYERQRLIIIEDEEPVVAMIEEFVNALWKEPIQVFIDSSLLEISLDEDDILGLNLGAIFKVGEAGGRPLTRALGTTPTGRGGTVFEAAGLSALGSTDGFKYGIINSNLEAVLEALHARKRVDLRSNPRVLVMNHGTASIIVGKEVPFTESEEGTGGERVRTIEFKEVAVRLDVSPHVSDKGLIFMNVRSSVKAVSEIVRGTDYPSLSTREAVTSVAMREGSTLIIGGLVQRNRTKSWSETPFLARIPLLGILFRQKSHSDEKNDLIFLLSPRLVTPEFIRDEFERRSHLIEEIKPHAGEFAPGQLRWE